jgi:hypothetical protein
MSENLADPREVLIAPTNDLMLACESVGVPLTLFCDVASVFRHRELGMHRFPDLVEEQLRDAVRRGHDVQAHLHPHWFFAEPHGARWIFPQDKFLLGKLASDDEGCRRIAAEQLARVKRYLEDLLRPVRPGYRCVAYRAGGYGIQPAERAVLAALRETGYVVDSSIVPGMRLTTEYNNVDFSGAPDLPNYRMSERSGLTPDGEGIFEVPIVAGAMPAWAFLRRLAAYARYRSGRNQDWRARGRGTLEVAASTYQGRLARLGSSVRRKASILRRRWSVLELGDDPVAMFALTTAYFSRFTSGAEAYGSFSSHSKTLSPAMLRALERYHRMLHKHYGSALSTPTLQGVASRVGGAEMGTSS